MAALNGTPTEHTALLSESVSNPSTNHRPGTSSTLPVDPTGGLVPQGPDAFEDGADTNDQGDVEANPSSEVNSVEYAGMPEVRKSMRYIFPAIAIGVFLSAADGTIIISSYGKIGSELHALNKTSWIANAYFLTLTAFQPLYGKLTDIFGRKECLLFSYTVFGLGCLFCGLAQDINQLILARAFAGLGGGGMTTIVSILFSDVIPLRERGTWQGYINIVYATGAASGAPLGGIIADYINWRWAFLLQVPLCLIAFAAVQQFLNLPKHNHGFWMSKLRRIDILGAILLLIAVSNALVGFDRGSNISWTDPITIACLAAALPLFGVFILIEIYVATEPFAPGHIIMDKNLIAAYLCNLFAFGGQMGMLFYFPLHLQAVYNMTGTEASLRLIPAIVCGVLGSLFGGFYMQRTGRYYWITVSCYSMLVLGSIVIVLFSGVLVSSIAGMVVGLMICSFSNGLGVTSSLVAIMANTTQHDQAMAIACSYLFRSMGSVFGVSLSATAVNGMLRSTLAHSLKNGQDANKIADMVRKSLDSIKTLDPAIVKIVRHCYAISTRVGFGASTALVSGAMISAWFIKEAKLNR